MECTGSVTSLCLYHAACYPAMEAQDGVKLLYQSSFYCRHLYGSLLQRADAVRIALRNEWIETPFTAAAPQTEPLGEDWVRLNLSALPYTEENVNLLFDALCHCAGIEPLPVSVFYDRLDILKALAYRGKMPFSGPALETYILSCLPADKTILPPPVPHSAVYRAAYHPAYRVLRRDDAGTVIRSIFPDTF